MTSWVTDWTWSIATEWVSDPPWIVLLASSGVVLGVTSQREPA